MKLVGAKQIRSPPRSSLWTVERSVFHTSLLRTLQFSKSRALGALLLSPVLLASSPVPPVPHGDLFSRLQFDLQVPAPAWRERQHGSRAGRKVAAGAWGMGGEAGIRASGRREQVGTRRLSELIPRAILESYPSGPARFTLFLPHSFAWDYTVRGCLCFWVWDFKLVEPIRSG